MNTGDPLECFQSGVVNGEHLPCVLDEDGKLYMYKGKPNFGSSTTIFGRWTGINPYADGLPIKVKGRNGPITSCLDSFSMLFYIQCMDNGFHNSTVEGQYIARIRKALDTNQISPSRDMNEFDAASAILRSYVLHGHTYDIVHKKTEFEPSIAMVGDLKPSGWSAFDPRTTFPMFTLSEEEADQYRQFLSVNGGSMLPKIEAIDALVEYMSKAGLEHTFEYNWFANKRMEQDHVQYAVLHYADQLNALARESKTSVFSIDLDGRYDRLRPTGSKLGSIMEELSSSITKDVIASLL